MIVGTAGHIDHGKTSLVRALTGRDTDRLPEEKRRGISIELGYAFQPLDGGSVLAFVDVPGHERFVHTMVAGATGVDLALLVIAADDGVMPQTREHLEILRLLGVSRGAIALTKIDAVEPSRVEEAHREIAQWLAGDVEAGWPVFRVSSRTGEGIEALSTHLRSAASLRDEGRGARFRMAIDRVFTLSGIGTVVTGTVHAGVVREGETIAIMPSGRHARVRSVHAQDRAAREGVAGERCALNLAGLDRSEVERGEWAQAATLENLSTRFDAVLRLSASESRSLVSSTVVRLHHGAHEVDARVAVLDRSALAAGESALVGLTTDTPLAVCKGDRYVLRDAAAGRTLGGGSLLDIDAPVRHRRAPERLALLAHLRDDAPPAALGALLACQPVATDRLASAWNVGDASLRAMLDALGARVASGMAFSHARWQSLRCAALEAVALAHAREPEMPGLEQKRLRRIVAPRLPDDVFAVLVDELLKSATIVRRGAFLALPEHKAELGNAERMQWEQLKPLMMTARFNPPRVRDLARATSMPEAETRALMRKVARVGEATLVAHDHYFVTSDVADLADIAAELGEEHGGARAAPFRDRIGGGRKVAIQILEFFDRIGYTRRVRDDHILRGPNPWRSACETACTEE